MIKRKLSGIFFRHQEEDGKWGNRVFEDLPEEAQDKMMEDRSEEWLKSLAKALARTLREIGDQFDIVKGAPEEQENTPDA